MCLLCTEVIKEKLTPKEFWSNYRELKTDDDHWVEVLAETLKTSKEYQEALSKSALDE